MKWGFHSKQEPFENLEPDDIIIVCVFTIRDALSSFRANAPYISVIGPSGAGKSLVSGLWNYRCHSDIGDQFINTAVDERLKVLLHSTKEFAYVRCTLENSHKVVFVDTRAYNDYDNGSEIREWLRKA